MRALVIGCALAWTSAGCGSHASRKAPATEAGEGQVMISNDAASADPTGACASARPALRTTLSEHPVDSFAIGAGRQALAALGVTADELLAVGRDAGCPNALRFAAFEGWVGVAGEAALGQVDDATAAAMAEVQAEAIRRADDASAWSLPPDVTSSVLSRHLVVLGRRALPALRPLLDDLRPLPIAGSETSAIAARRKYRIADLAAGLIAVIAGVPFQDGATPADRDPQRAALRQAP